MAPGWGGRAELLAAPIAHLSALVEFYLGGRVNNLL